MRLHVLTRHSTAHGSTVVAHCDLSPLFHPFLSSPSWLFLFLTEPDDRTVPVKTANPFELESLDFNCSRTANWLRRIERQMQMDPFQSGGSKVSQSFTGFISFFFFSLFFLFNETQMNFPGVTLLRTSSSDGELVHGRFPKRYKSRETHERSHTYVRFDNDVKVPKRRRLRDKNTREECNGARYLLVERQYGFPFFSAFSLLSRANSRLRRISRLHFLPYRLALIGRNSL